MQLADFSNHFDSLASRWDQSAWLAEERDLEQALRLLQPRRRETGLDLACGPGHLSTRLAAEGSRVLAADISPQMLKFCAHRSTEAGQKNLTIAVQDAHRMEFGDGMFDWISCRLGFRYFEEPRRVLAELKRILKPSGRIWLSDWIRDLPGGKTLTLSEMLRSLHAAQQTVHSMEEWEKAVRESGFRMLRQTPRPDRLDPVELAHLGGTDSEDAVAASRELAGPDARWLELEGRSYLLVQRLDLLLGI